MSDIGLAGKRKCQIFTSTIFLSHSTEKFHEGTLRDVVQKKSMFGKSRKKRGELGSIKIFRRKFFSQRRKF